jgi:hypothetical protein
MSSSVVTIPLNQQVNQVLIGWIMGLITTILLFIEWWFVALGMTGWFGFQVRPPSAREIPQNHLCGLTKSAKRAIAIVLFAAVTTSFIAALGTFLRKFLVFQNTEGAMYPAKMCFALCRSNVAFYGISKLIIYWQLYVKVVALTSVEPEPVRAKTILTLCVGGGSFAFAIGILFGVIDNVPSVQGGNCVCQTPIYSTWVFFVFDWVVSFVLLVYFTRPVLRQLKVRDNPSESLWRSVAMEQFILAIFMLIISPSLIAIFLYTSVYDRTSQFSLAVGALPTLDLTICCYAQALSSRKLWGRTNRFLCFSIDRPTPPLSAPLLDSSERIQPPYYKQNKIPMEVILDSQDNMKSPQQSTSKSDSEARPKARSESRNLQESLALTQDLSKPPEKQSTGVEPPSVSNVNIEN